MRELTPADHARIRRHLVLIPVYVWFFYSWTTLYSHLPPPVLPVRDFAHFYVQGTIARSGNTHALYDRDEQAALLNVIVPNSNARFPPVYGPQVAVFFKPLARLSYVAALYTWMGLSLLIYAACCYALWRVCPRLHDRRWMTLLLMVGAPALHFTLGFAQVSMIGLVCVTAGYLALRANRPVLAGIAIGSLAFKPPLGLAVAFVFVGAGEWRIVLGAAVAAAAQLGAGALYWGPSILVPYFHALTRLPGVASDMEPYQFHIHSWRSFFTLMRLPPRVALAVYAAAAVGTLVVALACWRRRGPLELRYAALLIATILVDPHMFVYDFILLVPAFMLLWNWVLGLDDHRVGELFPVLRRTSVGRRSFNSAFQWLLYFCYFSPLFGILAVTIRLQLSVLGLSLLGLVLWKKLDAH